MRLLRMVRLTRIGARQLASPLQRAVRLALRHFLASTLLWSVTRLSVLGFICLMADVMEETRVLPTSGWQRTGSRMKLAPFTRLEVMKYF